MRFLRVQSTDGAVYVVPLNKIVLKTYESQRNDPGSKGTSRKLCAYIYVLGIEIPLSDDEADKITAILAKLQ